MEKANKIILGMGSLVVVGFGIYKGVVNKKPTKYSMEWIKRLADTEWDVERDIIQQKFLNPKYNDSMRSEFQRLLEVFDKVKSDRDWAGLKPQGPAYSREHGRSLYKP